MYGASDFDLNEEQLRKRIRKAFLHSERPLPEHVTRLIEDGVLGLMEAYFRASVHDRQAVYEYEESRLLQTIRAISRDYPSRSSSKVRES